MKKVYTKPQIAFESFQLTSNIAGDCTTRPHLTDETTCGYRVDDSWIIFQGNPPCNFPIGQDGRYDKICYHVPTGDISVFTS